MRPIERNTTRQRATRSVSILRVEAVAREWVGRNDVAADALAGPRVGYLASITTSPMLRTLRSRPSRPRQYRTGGDFSDREGGVLRAQHSRGEVGLWAWHHRPGDGSNEICL